ncbi:MAG: trigger factor [Acholeplasmatales bacterium]|jgi:trigger factor|nr:trigger factor [Acholeplasmatales bacterium]
MSYHHIEKLEKTTKVFYEVTAEEFNHAMNHSFEHLKEQLKANKSKKILVNGFRNETLSLSVYLKHYGSQDLLNEAIDHVLNHKYHELVNLEEVFVYNAPRVEDFDVSKISDGPIAFTFSFEIDNRPAFTLGQYKGLTVNKENYSVSDQDVQSALSKLLEDKISLELKAEGSALENGDTAIFDFLGTVDGVAFEGGEASNYELKVGSHQFIPGFEEQLVGLKVNEQKDLKVKFPDDYHAKELAGKEANFKVTLHEIKIEKYPLLDNALIKELKIDGVHSEEELKAYLRNNALKEKKESEDQRVVNTLYSLAVANAKGDIPDSFLDDTINRLHRSVEEQAKKYNLDLDMYLKITGNTKEKLDEDLKNEAYRRVKSSLVIEAIADAEKFIPTEEEITQKVKEFASEYQTSEEDIRQNISLQEIIADVRHAKVLNLILTSAKKV